MKKRCLDISNDKFKRDISRLCNKKNDIIRFSETLESDFRSTTQTTSFTLVCIHKQRTRETSKREKERSQKKT